MVDKLNIKDRRSRPRLFVEPGSLCHPLCQREDIDWSAIIQRLTSRYPSEFMKSLAGRWKRAMRWPIEDLRFDWRTEVVDGRKIGRVSDLPDLVWI